MGPVERPPWSLHLPLWAVSRRLQGVPALVLAPHGLHGFCTVSAPYLHGVWFMMLRFVNLCKFFGNGDCQGSAKGQGLVMWSLPVLLILVTLKPPVSSNEVKQDAF